VALCAAAAMALLGMIVTMRCANPAVALCATAGVSMAERRDAMSSGSRGSSESWNGANTAANAAPALSSTRKITIARRAVRPDEAASLVEATPSTTSATTRGTTVICSALSHRSPMGCATLATSSAMAGSQAVSTSPSAAPPSRPANTRAVGDTIRAR
jgi:hypothetical protein